MPQLPIHTPRISMRINKSALGIERQITFLGIDWNEEARFLEIRFRCDYIVSKMTKVRDDSGLLVDKEIFEVVNDPQLGLKSFIQKFKADDNTWVDLDGNIIKYPLQEPHVDLNQVHYMTQYEFYYTVSRTHGFHMSMFEQFISQISAINGWNDFNI